MMDVNSDLMQALVTARQEELRRSSAPFRVGHEAGTLRRSIGNFLIRLGERVGGTERVPAKAAVPTSLAMQ